MKQKKYLYLTSAFMLLSSSAFAGQISVPGDFPGSFTMKVLSGLIVLDDPNIVISGATQASGTSFSLNSTGMDIGFDATAFDGIGVGAGTSSITTGNFSNYEIGTGSFFGFPINMSLYGNGTGSLVDNGNESGEWSLSIGTQFEWLDGTIFDLGVLDYSTANTAGYYIDTQPGVLQTVSGVAMDYQTGDAVFVAQTGILSGTPNGYLDGLRFTISIAGNDPIVQVVPIPGAVWLFGSGLLGLIGLSRRKKAV